MDVRLKDGSIIQVPDGSTKRDVMAIVAQQKEGRSWGQALSEGAGNFGANAIETGKGMAQAIANPGQVMEGIKNMPRAEGEPVTAVNVLLKGMLDKYRDAKGFSEERIKEAVATKPFEVFSDMIAMAYPAAKGTAALGTAAKVPQVANVAGKAVTVAELADPVVLAGKGIAKGISKLTPNPADLLEGVVKFGTSGQVGAKRADLLKTMLSERIPLKGGPQKLAELQAAGGRQLGGIIDAATERGVKFPQEQALYSKLNDVRRTPTTEPIAMGKQVDSIESQLRQHYAGQPTLTPREIQNLKTNTQNELASTYGKTNLPPGKTKAKQAVASANREILETLDPKVKDLNQALARYHDLEEPLLAASNRIGNRAALGFRDMMLMTGGSSAGGLTGGPSGLGLGALGGLAVSQAFQPKMVAKYAQMLYDTEKATKGLRGAIAKMPKTPAVQATRLISERKKKKKKK